MKKGLVADIFYIINQIVSGTEIIFSRSSLIKKLSEIERLQYYENRYLNRGLKRLEGQNLIESINRKGQFYYRLTEKGIRKIEALKLKESSRRRQKWDGYWRVVIWDIPEIKKVVREALRRKLRSLNFYPLQKSVFVSPFNYEKEIDDLAKIFEIEDALQTLLVKSLGRKEEEARQFFVPFIKK